MRNLLLNLLLTIFVFQNICAQTTCEVEEDPFDLGKISKCTITGSKSKADESKTRYLKRRKSRVGGLGNLNSSGVQSESLDAGKDHSLDLSASADNIAKLKEKISKEQLENSFKFNDVDRIPLFEDCKKINKTKASACFNAQMMKHIQEHFTYPYEAIMNRIEGEVWVRFIIDEEGNVTNLKTLAPKNADLLKIEAERVVSKLPRLKPAVKDGKKVLVKYGFPINFSLGE